MCIVFTCPLFESMIRWQEINCQSVSADSSQSHPAMPRWVWVLLRQWTLLLWRELWSGASCFGRNQVSFRWARISVHYLWLWLCWWRYLHASTLRMRPGAEENTRRWFTYKRDLWGSTCQWFQVSVFTSTRYVMKFQPSAKHSWRGILGAFQHTGCAVHAWCTQCFNRTAEMCRKVDLWGRYELGNTSFC